jgi:hypothetical protein
MTPRQQIEAVLRSEGGYTDHPADAGGPTNCGITIPAWQDYCRAVGRADWLRQPREFNREADVILVAPGAQQAARLEFPHTVHVTLYPGSPGENAVFYGRDASGQPIRNTVALAGGLTAESYQAMATLDRISIPLGAGENCISTFLIQRGRGVGLPEALAQNSIRDVLFNGTTILADCTIPVSGGSTSPAGTVVKLPNASSSYEAGSEITVIYERGA